MACKVLSFFATILLFGACASAENALHTAASKPHSGFLKATGLQRIRHDLHQAIGAALGAGTVFSQAGDIQKVIMPIWASLAKNEHGRVDRRSLRYVVSRYFLKMHSISIIGLERHHDVEEALIFTEIAPNHVNEAVEKADEHTGYAVTDAVAMIVMLRELVYRDTNDLLADIRRNYTARGVSFPEDLKPEQVNQLIEDYLVYWMVGEDEELRRVSDRDRTMLVGNDAGYQEFAHFAHGLVRAFQHAGWKGSASTLGNSGAWRPFRDRFGFEDVQAIAGNLHLSFGSFWHSECSRIKEALVKLEYAGSGRILLSDFHTAALDGDWRFSESKEYLKVIGALDEVPGVGPAVVLSNYIYGPSNCIVSSKYFRVCCRNECEDHMNEIEDAIGAPVASPELLFAVVENITFGLHDGAKRLSSSLKSQLIDISRTNYGTVPIHGRLFALWLHYVFPQDCPFPHKVGSISSASPHQYGRGFAADMAEMEKHSVKLFADSASGDASSNTANATVVASQPRSYELVGPWNEEEELLSEHVLLHAPWQRTYLPMAQAALGLAALAGFLWMRKAKDMKSVRAPTSFDLGMKSHYV